MRYNYYFSYFIDEETKAEKVKKLAQDHTDMK